MSYQIDPANVRLPAANMDSSFLSGYQLSAKKNQTLTEGMPASILETSFLDFLKIKEQTPTLPPYFQVSA